MNDIYNKLYVEGYNDPIITDSERKWNYIKEYIPTDSKTVVDLGCGRGFNSFKLLADGKIVVCVEPSHECCSKYLSDTVHYCCDIPTFAKIVKTTFDVVLCTDVLEHIDENEIDNTLNCIKNIGKRIILGIANHSDIINGEELHVIQKPVYWWFDKVNKIIGNTVISKHSTDRYFILVCQ